MAAWTSLDDAARFGVAMNRRLKVPLSQRNSFRRAKSVLDSLEIGWIEFITGIKLKLSQLHQLSQAIRLHLCDYYRLAIDHRTVFVNLGVAACFKLGSRISQD
jgi:hypothetical protein